MVRSGGPILLRSWMQQLESLRRRHKVEVIWVTSGAIASARERANIKKTQKLLAEKQALSAIGQPLIMDLYNLALQSVGRLGAQILLTYDDLRIKERRTNLRNTIEKLLQWGVVPVLNENDAISTDEIKFGDNDTLSAKVAAHLEADRLVILTDVEGYYDSNPSKNRSAKLIPFLPTVTPKMLAHPGLRSASRDGTGGMYSKLIAARTAHQNGIDTWLVKGDMPSVLLKVAAGESVGTRIQGKQK